MAISPKAKYPTKTTPVSTSYPYGGAQNVTVAGDNTGTPWEAELVNDILGFQQALLTEATIVPSGSAETALVSQYLTAVKAVTLANVVGTANTFTKSQYGTIVSTAWTSTVSFDFASGGFQKVTGTPTASYTVSGTNAPTATQEHVLKVLLPVDATYTPSFSATYFANVPTLSTTGTSDLLYFEWDGAIYQFVGLVNIP